MDLHAKRVSLTYPNFRRRKVRLDFDSKCSWVTSVSRRVYQQVDQMCAWVVTVIVCGDVWLNMLMGVTEMNSLCDSGPGDSAGRFTLCVFLCLLSLMHHENP